MTSYTYISAPSAFAGIVTFGALWRRSVFAIWRIEVIVRAAPEEAAVSYNPSDVRRLTWLPVALSTVPESL